MKEDDRFTAAKPRCQAVRNGAGFDAITGKFGQGDALFRRYFDPFRTPDAQEAQGWNEIVQYPLQSAIADKPDSKPAGAGRIRCSFPHGMDWLVAKSLQTFAAMTEGIGAAHEKRVDFRRIWRQPWGRDHFE